MACTVPGCSNRISAAFKGSDPKVSFHRFPQDNELKNKWIKNVRKDHNWRPTQYTRICSGHFEESCFREGYARRILHSHAVPTILPKRPVSCHQLPNANANKIQYRVKGSVSQVRPKRGCQPTKFEVQSDKTELTTAKRGPCIAKTQKKKLIGDSKQELDKKNVLKSHAEIRHPSKLSSDGTIDATTSSGVCQVIEEDLPVALTLQTSNDDPVVESCHSSSTESAESGPDDSSNFMPPPEKIQTSVEDKNMDYSTYRLKCNTIIANVYRYLQKEYVSLQSQLGGLCDVSVMSNTLARTAAATGVSQDEVEIALRETALHSDQTSKPEETHSSAGVRRPRIIRRNKRRSKTLESTNTSTTEVQTTTWRKKTNAQKCREYRERIKLQNTMLQIITAERSDECSETDQLQAKRPKTNAERRKKHYEAQKLKKQKSKKIPKTDKQRSKECYERKKKLQALNTFDHHSDAENKSDNSETPLKRKATDESVPSKPSDEGQLPFPAPIQLRVLGVVETECKIEPVDEPPTMDDLFNTEFSSNCGTAGETQIEIKTEPVDDESLQKIINDPLALEWTPTALQEPSDPPDFTEVKSEHVDHDYADMFCDTSIYDKKRPDIEPKPPSQ